MRAEVLYRAAFHGAILVVYMFALVATLNLPPLPPKKVNEQWGGIWKYLTYWNLMARFLYFAVSFYIDFMKSPSRNYNSFTKIRDRMFAGIVFPYGVFVVSSFWTLYTIDRELVLPKVWDEVFPLWLNHMSHTLILPVLLIETFILRHEYPSRKEGLILTAAFGMIYMIWLLYLVFVKNIWPYPFLEILNWSQRILFFGGSIVFLSLAYHIGERINACYWGDGNVTRNKYGIKVRSS